MFIWLLKPRSNLFLYALCLLIVGLWLCFLCGPHFSWLGYRNGSGDLAQHFSGWYAFVGEPWHFPLLKINSLDYPTGTNLSLTDSIPLFALFFKLVRGMLPADFNYFSIFFLFCYVTQAIAATTLAVSLRQRNILGVIAFTLFAITTPVFTHRLIGNDSLACQSLILFALALYFFNHQQRCALRQLQVYFGLLICLSLLIHPYLTAMCYPFYLISLYEFKQAQPLQKILSGFLCVNLIIAVEFLIFGLGTFNEAVGFGACNMNFLAPLYGGYFAHGSIFIWRYQEEGFAYLGLGLIALIGYAFYLLKAQFQTVMYAYWSLFWLSILFLIYATYGSIDFGHFELVRYRVPFFFLTEDFLANGRFFWPCTYILLSFAVATLLKKAPKMACIVLPGLLALQLFDVSPYTAGVKASLQNIFVSNNTPANIMIMSKMKQAKLIIYYPRFNCNTMSKQEYALLIQTQLLAAYSHTPINTAYTAHAGIAGPQNCGDDSPKLAAMSPQLLIAEVADPSPTMRNILRTDPAKCSVIGAVYYCVYSAME